MIVFLKYEYKLYIVIFNKKSFLMRNSRSTTRVIICTKTHYWSFKNIHTHTKVEHTKEKCVSVCDVRCCFATDSLMPVLAPYCWPIWLPYGLYISLPEAVSIQIKLLWINLILCGTDVQWNEVKFCLSIERKICL